MADHGNSLDREGVPRGRTLIIIIVFTSITFYSAVELAFIIYATFIRRSGLYFWSFVVATFGLVPHAIGFLLKAHNTVLGWGYVTLYLVGWVCMVTGQSLVLYSRLHLVLHNDTQLRIVRNMIIFNAVVLHTPPFVLCFGLESSNPAPFVAPMIVFEKIQVTIFFLQEIIISGLYIKETIKLLRIRQNIDEKGRGRQLMVHLIIVNVVVALLDINVLALEFAGLYNVQTAYKGWVYSVKLKVEFSILNRLVELTKSAQGSTCTRSNGDGGGGVQLPQIFDGTQDPETQGQDSGSSDFGNSVVVARVETLTAKPEGPSVVKTTEVVVERDIAPGSSSYNREGLQ
ncbi:hypothetical protein QBC34DRAFT_440880 [Podospora aff. communis PSN243]|uniref:DUF7703 domain-containing protein n=1 Tax=Podospora aff. communis PSN243 TaxID=3040156 RepID=A0AAV9GEJ7_9PEZI|nr:hypothetical protein QBC34DRAFT_440880 [Podospora aff. communis PSN243]